MRYLRVGGRRQRHFDGASSKPRKLPENAATPTRRVHVVLGAVELKESLLKKDVTANLANTLRITFTLATNLKMLTC